MSGTGNAQGDFGSFAIDVRGLSRSYGGHTVVDGVTFGVRPGVITGFLGPNGAGKSTTMRMMIGLTPPTSGRCTVLGHDYRHLPNPAAGSGCCWTRRRSTPGAPAARCSPSRRW